MFEVNDDMSIYLTRGDTALLNVSAMMENGNDYLFVPGDVVRFKVSEKKACENVIFQKDFPITTETPVVEMLLTKAETKIGEVISKPTDYWYEVELNPDTNPQTVIGYDDDGPKIIKLFPEGADIDTSTPIKPEDIPIVDEELDLLSDRPVQNRAIARAVSKLDNDVSIINARLFNYATLKEGSTTADAELADIRVGFDLKIYPTAGDAVREQIRTLTNNLIEPVELAVASADRAEEARDNAIEAMEEAKELADAAELSAEHADACKRAAADTAEYAVEHFRQSVTMIEAMNARLGVATFELDANGGLYYTDDTPYRFELDDNGLLSYEFLEEREGE